MARPLRRPPFRLVRLPLLLTLLLTVVACGGPQAPTAEPTGEVAASDPTTATEPAPTGSAAAPQPTEARQPETVEEVLAQVEGLDAEARRAELRRMAEQEPGPLLVYTSFTLMTDILDVLRESLRQATGLEMEIYRASSEAVQTRLLQEAQADTHNADVIETAARVLEQLGREGLTAPYDSPSVEALIDGAAHEHWDATRLNVYTVAWNTDQVAEDQRPQSYRDLADDRWAGRLTLEPSDWDWFWSVSNYLVQEQGMSEADVAALWQEIAANADFVSGHTSTLELVAAGQYSVMASAFAPTVERLRQEGRPVAWQPAVEPLFTAPNGASIYAHTTRPASAVLFMDWLFSDAMEIFDDNEIFVTREDLQDPSLEGLDMRIIDIPAYLDEEAAVMDAYELLTR